MLLGQISGLAVSEGLRASSDLDLLGPSSRYTLGSLAHFCLTSNEALDCGKALQDLGFRFPIQSILAEVFTFHLYWFQTTGLLKIE